MRHRRSMDATQAHDHYDDDDDDDDDDAAAAAAVAAAAAAAAAADDADADQHHISIRALITITQPHVDEGDASPTLT